MHSYIQCFILLPSSQKTSVVSIYPSSLITDEAVVAENLQTSETVTFPADKVVLCLGSVPNATLYNALKDKYERIYNVGDSDSVGKILKAVQMGFDAAINM